MNCAFEDCTELNACIGEFGNDWNRVFHAYQERRKRNADAIADLALQNFIEMRDRVADSHFLLMKEVGLALEARYPTHFIPLYSMVTFHRVPYAVAMERGVIQREILEEVTRGISVVEEVNWDSAGELIRSRLRPYADDMSDIM